MRPELLDIGSSIRTNVTLNGAANLPVVGAAVQRAGEGFRYDSCQFVVAAGTATGSPVAISVAGKLQDSGDGASGWADVAAPATAPVVAENGQAKVNVILRGCQPFIRCVVTPTLTAGTTPAIPVVGVLVMGGNEIDG